MKILEAIVKANKIVLFLAGFLIIHFTNNIIGVNGSTRIFTSAAFWFFLFYFYEALVKLYESKSKNDNSDLL